MLRRLTFRIHGFCCCRCCICWPISFGYFLWLVLLYLIIILFFLSFTVPCILCQLFVFISRISSCWNRCFTNFYLNKIKLKSWLMISNYWLPLLFTFPKIKIEYLNNNKSFITKFGIIFTICLVTSKAIWYKPGPILKKIKYFSVPSDYHLELEIYFPYHLASSITVGYL